MDFKELLVWEKSHKLAVMIYKTTEKFPSGEKYGLVSQIRRSASSVPANLAEGAYQVSRKQFARYVGIARGSAAELECHLILSKDLGLINKKEFELFDKKISEIQKMLSGLYKSLEKAET